MQKRKERYERGTSAAWKIGTNNKFNIYITLDNNLSQQQSVITEIDFVFSKIYV